MGAGEVRFVDGRITAVEALPREGLTAAEAGRVVMPALANAHDHGRGLHSLSFGAADSDLESWMPALGRQPVVDPYANAALAFARMAESGICATNHCHNTQSSATLLAEAEAVSRAARDVGIRVAFAWPFFDRNPHVYGDPAKLGRWLPPEEVPGDVPLRSLERNIALMREAEAFEHPLFELQYGPVGPQWVQEDTLSAIARASAETGRRVHMHMFETVRQREWADHAYPGGLLRWLDGIGLLSSRLTLAHAIWLDRAEQMLLAERGVNIAVNGSSNMRLRSGTAPVAAMRRLGLAVGLGMDGMSFDDDDDMLREMRLCWRSHADGLDRGDPFDMAMRNGRLGIVGEDGGGRIEIGSPADLLLLGGMGETIDPVTFVLERASKAHVDRVIVAGREVVAQGRCTGIDARAMEQVMFAAGRTEMLHNPPDELRIARMQAAVTAFYAAGCHCGRA
jgi:cytosine/adenosine deaminase-related metal-dependent hydrolase